MTATTTTPATGAGGPGKRLMAAGVLALIVGVLAAAGLWYSAGQRFDDGVSGLARAPVGCDTTLDFASNGTFLLFIETKGTIDDTAGDCTADTEYDSTGSDVPSVSITMLDPEGREVTLVDTSGATYDTSGFVGESIRSVEVTTAGDHVLRVESSADEFAIAVGRDPNDGVGLLKLGAALAAIAGLIIGGLLLVRSSRQNDDDHNADGAWPVDSSDGWVTTPPGMPVQTAPPGWQPAAGPPTQLPSEVPPVSPTIPAPPAQNLPPTFPGLPPVPGGGTGDGERSPWAPPSDAAQ